MAVPFPTFLRLPASLFLFANFLGRRAEFLSKGAGPESNSALVSG